MTATPDIIPSDLTLEVDENLSPEGFMTAARAFFGYVHEIGIALSTDGDEPKWIVRVREGSTLFGLEPVLSAPAAIVQAIYNKASTGIDCLLTSTIDECGLSEGALKHLRTLSELTTRHKDRPTAIRLWVRKKPQDVNAKLADIIREDWRTDYTDFGSIEGRLESIGDKDGQIRLHVRDPMFKQTVRCYVPEVLLPEAFVSFRKRVEVFGQIHYRKNGTPISISAEKVEQFPDDSELPTFDDVRGIMSAII